MRPVLKAQVQQSETGGCKACESRGHYEPCFGGTCSELSSSALMVHEEVHYEQDHGHTRRDQEVRELLLNLDKRLYLGVDRELVLHFCWQLGWRATRAALGRRFAAVGATGLGTRTRHADPFGMSSGPQPNRR